jgi:hypothetical protein
MSNTSLDQFLHNLTFHAKTILPEAWTRLDAYGDCIVITYSFGQGLSSVRVRLTLTWGKNNTYPLDFL